MKHVGDITKIHGYDLPVVDVVTGGSPCQDLSVAGGRSGLAGERSGLFMEMVRIIKEMRFGDENRPIEFVRPRYAVWENVTGAFSSNKGEDFAAVIEEFIKVADDSDIHVSVPRGGWPKSGCISDDCGRYSIAWRVHDAQFWGPARKIDGRVLDIGTPQRRKRIALVADFGGLSAPEILFERKGMSRDPEKSRYAREGFTGTACESAERSGRDVKTYRKQSHPMNKDMPQNYEETETSDTLNVFDNSESRTPTLVFENHSQDTRYRPLGETCQTVSATYGTGGNNQPLVVKATCIGNGQADIASHISHEVCQTLNCMHSAMDILHGSTVRRLTPKECERLQGFPDDWTDIGEWVDTKGKKHKPADSPRYKALGNSICLPFWQHLARRICSQYERNITMGSLFDGIAGFCLAFKKCGADPIWASEIEEFPIAVCKKHFGDDETGLKGDVNEYL